jgi:Fe-S oxidoreductase
MIALTLVEKLILALIIVGSLSLFLRRFLPVLDKIRRAKPESGYRVDDLGRRINTFVWEVLLQGKVIRQRPLPGLAHAFVFWGFCAFALVTLNHIASGFGIPFLTEDGAFSRFYMGLAAIFGVAVAISIAGLFVRRFFVRPPWLGDHVSVESGFIAGLIFMLMVTYLLRFVLGEESVAGKANWWAHTLSLFVFLPLIPHTKHLHLVMSPVTVFLKREGFSQIPPLVGDEDFGLDTGKDLTNVIALQAYSCVECGRCTEHCPASLTGKLLNPKEVALGMRRYLNEFGPGSEEPLLGKHQYMEAAFQCTTCGSCEYQCPVGVQHLPMLIGLRRGAVNTGKWEDDYGNKLFLNLERNGNPMGFSSNDRDKFIQKQGFPIYDGTQEYCLWMGCMGSYDPQGREIVTALARVMQHLGVTFGVLKKERCTGDSARRLGNDLVFQQLAEQNLETFSQNKVKKIISICPHCVRTMSVDWKEFGEAPPVEHHSEFLARHAGRLQPAGSAAEKTVFHDPCYLGRYRGNYDDPRSVASLAGPLVEAERSRERSFCCGAGGGLAFLGEEKGKRVSVERAGQLAATGASVIGAACPFCNTMFRDALSTLGPAAPKLLDIAQIAAAGLPVQAVMAGAPGPGSRAPTLE